MDHVLTLAAKGSKTEPGEGELFMFAESLTSDVVIEYRLRLPSGVIVNGADRMSSQDQLEFAGRLVEFTVRNPSAASNTVRLRTGYSKYHPRTDAGQVEVVGTVDTTGSSVSVTGTVDVTGSAVSISAPVDINGTVPVDPQASASGGGTPDRIISAASTNTTAFKMTPGKVYTLNGTNTAGAAVFLKFYNKTGAPVLASDVPVMTLAIPPGTFSFDFGPGAQFSAGIAYAITAAIGDTDATAVGAGDLVASIVYK